MVGASGGGGKLEAKLGDDPRVAALSQTHGDGTHLRLLFLFSIPSHPLPPRVLLFGPNSLLLLRDSLEEEIGGVEVPVDFVPPRSTRWR